MLSSGTIYTIWQIVYPITLGLFNFCVVIGIWLWFKHPFYVWRMLKWYSLYRSGFISSCIQVDKNIIRMVERGKPDRMRTSLLFLHGYGGDVSNWTSVIEMIPTEGEHIIMVDLPGHGKSDCPSEEEEMGVVPFAKTVNKLLQTIGLPNQKLHVVGQSLGGSIAGAYATLFPEQVELVTMIAPMGFCGNDNEFYRRMKAGDYSWILPTTPEEFGLMLRKIAYRPIQISGQLISGELIDRLCRHEYLLQLGQLLGEEANLPGIFKFAPEIKQPVSILWGQQDEMMAVENCNVLKSKLPSCIRADLIDECGHSINLDQPHSVVKYLLLFRKDYELKKYK